MCLHRAHVLACSFGLLFGLVSAQPLAADKMHADTGRIEQPLDRLGFDVVPATPTPLVLSLLDPSPIRANLASFSPLDAKSSWAEPSSANPAPLEQPFGLRTLRAPPGLLWTKWEMVGADIEAEAPALARCRANIRYCSKAQARFVAIVKEAARQEGRARLALINERVNAAITYTTDQEQWNVSDRWSAPLDTKRAGAFDTGLGDCEDIAIAKYVALREAGTPSNDLQILMVRDTSAGIFHAVLAARHDDKWLILDNRRSRLFEENDATFFTPLFALGVDGVKRFTNDDDRSAHLKARKSPMRGYAAKPA